MSGVPRLVLASHFDCVLGAFPVEAGASWEKEGELDHVIGEEFLEVLLLSRGEWNCGHELMGVWSKTHSVQVRFKL